MMVTTKPTAFYLSGGRIVIFFFVSLLFYQCKTSQVCSPSEFTETYHCYYPRIKDEAVVWQRCQQNTYAGDEMIVRNDCDWRNLDDQCYLLLETIYKEVNGQTLTYFSPKNGSNPKLELGGVVTDNLEGNFVYVMKYMFEQNAIEIEENLYDYPWNTSNLFRFPSTALRYDPLYADFVAEAAAGGCPDTFNCLSEESKESIKYVDFNVCYNVGVTSEECDYPTNGRVTTACGVVPCPANTWTFSALNAIFDPTNLVDKATDYAAIRPPMVYPILKSDANAQPGLNHDYYIDTNSLLTDDNSEDVGNNRSVFAKDFRYMYNKVVLPQRSTDLYTLVLKYPDNTEEFIKFDGSDANLKYTIRYCGRNASGDRIYVVRFRISKAGNHILQLFSQKSEGDLKTLATSTSVSIGDLDFYRNPSTGVSSAPYLARQLNLVPLKLAMGSTMPVPLLKIGARKDLIETLEDAFSLNEKRNLVNDGPTATINIHEGIKINMQLPPCDATTTSTGANPFFDNQGNLKIRADLIKQYVDANNGLFVSYVNAIFETYSQLFRYYYTNNCSFGFNQSDDLSKVIVFYGYGFVLSDRAYNTLTAAQIQAQYPNIGNPLNVLADFYGFSGPDSSPNKMDNNLVSGAYKEFINTANFNVTSDQAATIILAHELGHAWANEDMVDHTAISAADAHNAYCTGFNATKCVFRYSTPQEMIDLFDIYNTRGIIWCEAHQQIILNQLLRKSYTQ